MKDVQGFKAPDFDTFLSKITAGSYDSYGHTLPAFPMDGSKYTEMINSLSLSNKRTAVDVGSGIGIIANALSPLFTDVICFEPSTSNIECLKENTKSLSNVTVNENGLWDSETSKFIRLRSFNDSADISSESYYVVDSADGSDNEEATSLKTLDSYNLQNVDLISVYCNGAECQVLEGANDLIDNQSPTIIYQNYNHQAELLGKTYADVENYLYGKGYAITALDTFKDWNIISFYVATPPGS